MSIQSDPQFTAAVESALALLAAGDRAAFDMACGTLAISYRNKSLTFEVRETVRHIFFTLTNPCEHRLLARYIHIDTTQPPIRLGLPNRDQ